MNPVPEVILISLIGRGRRESGGKGYQKTIYRFPDGTLSSESAFFGNELFKYLVRNNLEVERWIIFGTATSCWSEIIEAVEKADEDLDRMYYRVFEEEDRSEGISKDTLREWSNCINKFLNLRELRFIDVSPTEYSAFVNTLMEVIPEDKEYKVVFDLTHGFRHMPFIVSFSLMYLANFKRIKEIDVYYGAYEMGNDEVKPVLKIDFINELYSLSTAFNIYDNLGYFPEFLDRIGIKGSDNVYFKLEMNRNPRKDIRELVNLMEDKEKIVELYIRKPIERIKRDLASMTKLRYLDERMVERAKFYFEKKQYLKSLILLYEALVILGGRFYAENDCASNNKDYSDYKRREEIRGKIKAEIVGKIPKLFIKDDNMGELFNRLEYIRNAAAHGSTPRTDQACLENCEYFKEVFCRCVDMYYKLKESMK
jgi:cell division protein DivIC